MGTYSQMYIHLVFGVKYRDCLIADSWKEELNQYITGIIQNFGHKLIVINGTQDHIHILVGYKPKNSISDLVRHIKADSSKWINQRGFCPCQFRWQEGFGAFSYSHSHIKPVINYIMNQEEHHKKINFRDEYIHFLKAFNIKFEEQYLPQSVL